MRPETLGLIIGGVVPALFFAFSNLSVKLSTQQGISPSFYVLITGIGVACVGLVLLLLFPERIITTKSGIYAFVAGCGWASGVACVSFALTKYGANISQLTPLFNVNTLFTVLIALWIFSEWRQVQVPQLLLGSLMIVVGSVLVARA